MNRHFRSDRLAAVTLALGAFGALSTPGAALAIDAIDTVRMESRIETTYELSPYLRSHAIDVAVSEQGVVTLGGVVNEAIDRELAEQIALGVDGVKSVRNDIKVEPDHAPGEDRTGRSFGDKVDDFSIGAAVKSKLLWSKNTDGMGMHVTSKDGVVTLEGQAKSDLAKALAGNIALNTEGARRVDNRLVVVPKATAAAAGQAAVDDAVEAVEDAWITSRVKSTYLYSGNLDSADIAVSTQEGVVTLRGSLDTGAEQELAVALANNVRGVVSVNADALTSGGRP